MYYFGTIEHLKEDAFYLPAPPNPNDGGLTND